MAKEKWANAYVQANIRKTEKGYHCKMPDLVAYPAGAGPNRYWPKGFNRPTQSDW